MLLCCQEVLEQDVPERASPLMYSYFSSDLLPTKLYSGGGGGAVALARGVLERDVLERGSLLRHIICFQLYCRKNCKYGVGGVAARPGCATFCQRWALQDHI